jgi:hypothetical protein
MATITLDWIATVLRLRFTGARRELLLRARGGGVGSLPRAASWRRVGSHRLSSCSSPFFHDA